MNSSLAMLPLILVGFSAVLVLFLELMKSFKLARIVTLSVIFITGFLAFKLGEMVWIAPIVSQASSWKPPFGITFYLDLLSVGMIYISCFVIFCSLLAGPNLSRQIFDFKHINSLFLFLFFGVVGALSTGDFFNLYVWFEVFLVSSFAILSFASPKSNGEGVFKYIILNIVGSALFLIGLSLLYSSTGTLNMAQVAEVIRDRQLGPHFLLAVASIASAFLIKMGSFPLYGWLPFTYPQVSGVVTAIFSALLTKVGVFCLLRMHTLGMLPQFQVIGLSLLAATMVFGVVLALGHKSIFSILSHHIISQVGYIAVGIFIGGVQALTATLFYLFHHIVVKSNLFLIGAVLESKTGTTELKILTRFKSPSVFLSIAFVIAAGSLAGIPPLSGFWAKFYLIQSTFELKTQSLLMWVLIASMLIASVMTLLSMIKIWSAAFLETRENIEGESPRPLKMKLATVSIFMMCTWTVVMGLGSDKAVSVVEKMASQISGPSLMIQAVRSQEAEVFK